MKDIAEVLLVNFNMETYKIKVWRKTHENCSNRFPGSNCDIDMYEAFRTVCQADVEYVSYKEKV